MRRTKRKAFTLVELLVVVAVIGILFVVLLSKVDFATDKAKATGVQTDFRSFQLAFEAVAKENAGFNTFGWDEGDVNGDRIRNNVDAGDLPANGGNGNGVLDNDETAIGRKVYTETWTGIYSLNNPKAGATDEEKISAVKALEAAVNKNLDPKLHITITPVDSDSDGLFDEYNVTMSNQARDPWKNQYHGHFITNASEKSTTNTSLNATPDGKDRGAFVIYSDGANGKDGSVEDIIGGKVIVSVLLADKEASSVAGTTDNNKDGKDDYSVAVVYTYENGYGEVSSSSTGFSNNQGTVNSVLAGNPGAGGGGGAGGVTPPPIVISDPIDAVVNLTPGLYAAGTFRGFVDGTVTSATPLKMWEEMEDEGMVELDWEGQLVFNVGTPGDIVIPVSCSLYASSTMIDCLFPGQNSVAFAEGFVVTNAVNGSNFCVVERDCFVPASMSLETSASDMFGTYFLGTIKMSEQSQIFINKTKAAVLAQYKIVDRLAHIDAGVSEYVSYSLDEFVTKHNNGDFAPHTIFDSPIACGEFDFVRDESIEIDRECAWITVQCSDGSLDLLAFSNGWD